MDSAMNLQKIDHLVLAVADIERSCHFYCDVMGMHRVTFGENRTALHFGESKINLYPIGWDYYLKAGNPSIGSADLCFIVDEDVCLLKTSLMGLGVEVIEGPIARTGAIGDLLSIYVRDPDGNLIELTNQTSESGKEVLKTETIQALEGATIASARVRKGLSEPEKYVGSSSSEAPQKWSIWFAGHSFRQRPGTRARNPSSG